MNFREFAIARFQIAGQKYIEDGENAAFHRDNYLDILEEIADAYIIARFAEMRGIGHATELVEHFNELGGDIMVVWKDLADEFKDENVERIVTP